MVNWVHTQLDVIVVNDANDAKKHGFDYVEWSEPPKLIEIKKVVVVRHGTVGGRSTADFILEDETGQKFVFMITGSLLNSIPL